MARAAMTARVVAALLALPAVLPVAACRSLPPGAECRSLDGRPLFAAADPLVVDEGGGLVVTDRDRLVMGARELAYAGHYREAVAELGRILDAHPGDPFVLRHRGHRWITLRELGRAVDDLERAADACRTTADVVEPDGRPTPGRPPHGTLHFNVHYHLGLARFLTGDWTAAEHAWLDCLAVARNDESRVAVTHWLWCARMRGGDPAGAAAVVAPIRADMDVVENRAYHQLCLLYANRLSRAAIVVPDGSGGAALRFGLAHFDFVTGDRAAVQRAFEALEVLAVEPGWAAFGVIAAEAELARR
jgi:hypothetical protein